MLKAILINPYLNSIKEVEIEAGLDPIYKELSSGGANPVQCFTCVDVSADGETAYLDDEGLYTQTHFFKFATYHSPLAGNALILGTDASGESISTKLTVIEVARMVQFMGECHVDNLG